MLDARLEENGGGKCKDVAGAANGAVLVVGIVEFVQRGAAKVHRADGVADEGVCAGIGGLGIAGALPEVQVLRGKHSLRGYVVGVHSFPTARQGATVEDTLNTELIGIGEDVLVELHHLLLVASEEVYLDAENAVLLHPRHLLAACAALVHLAYRCLRSVVPRAVAVVPEEDSYALLTSVACQLSRLFIAYLCIPEGVDEYRAPAHSGREIDIAFLLVEIARGVHTNNPRPGALAIGVLP